MKIFLMAASLRRGSFNKKLIRITKQIADTVAFCETELCEFNEFPMPLYNGDLEEAQGIPEGVLRLAEKISGADAVIISSPEYNGSIPGTLKNTIDWLSRLDPVPLAKKHILLIGASPGQLGGVRGNLHGRVPLHVLGAFVYPEYHGLSRADQSFDDNDQLKDEKQVERLRKLVIDFIHYSARQEAPFETLTEFLDSRLHKKAP